MGALCNLYHFFRYGLKKLPITFLTKQRKIILLISKYGLSPCLCFSFSVIINKNKKEGHEKRTLVETTMSSIAISASLQRACSSNHVSKKQMSQTKTTRSLGTKQLSNVVTLNVEQQQEKSSSHTSKPNDAENELKLDLDTTSSHPKFIDCRWKNGTWDLNMFVKDGKMDWDAVIVAEARRRKILEMFPESATNEEPVVFRSSVIPWWAWLLHSYLPQAELLNGRAAMVGFFTAYVVDALTGLDVVGQTGNFICKAGVFVTVAGIILLRKKEDFTNLKNLADEATLYDKQWQASWQDQNASSSPAKKI